MSADFIAGAYTATYNSKALGQTAEGWRISETVLKRLITGDAGGDTPQDAIYRGREVFFAGRLIEADKAAFSTCFTRTRQLSAPLANLGLLAYWMCAALVAVLLHRVPIACAYCRRWNVGQG